MFDPWVGKIPWRREWLPTPVFLPGEFYGQRNLVGYSPWCHKELDTTEQLTTHTHTRICMGFYVALVVKNPCANAGDIRDTGLIFG